MSTVSDKLYFAVGEKKLRGILLRHPSRIITGASERMVSTNILNRHSTIMRQSLDYNVRNKQISNGFRSNKGYLPVIKLLVT